MRGLGKIDIEHFNIYLSMFARYKFTNSFLAHYVKLRKLFGRVLEYRKRGIAIGKLAIVLIAFVSGSVALTTIAGQLTPQTVIGSSGEVETIGVGVYWDINCSEAVSNITWGLVKPGSDINVSVFVRNEGNVDARLYLGTRKWSPSNASSYITLSWDYGQQLIGPWDFVKVTLTLSISDSIEGITDFDFDIIIAAG